MKHFKSDLVDVVNHFEYQKQKEKAEPVLIQLFRYQLKMDYFFVASTTPLK